MREKIPNVKKIAVVRANALGDFIFSLPALQALRGAYPTAKIILLGKTWHKEFLSGRISPIDDVIIIPPIPGVGESENSRSEKQIVSNFFDMMNREKFDIALQLHGGGKYSNPFTNNLGARLTVGLQTPDSLPLDISVPYIYYQNEYLRYLEVVSHVGANAHSFEPKVLPTLDDVKEAQQVIFSLGIPTKTFVIIHPGASDLRRRWSIKKFSEVGDFLAGKGFSVLLTGIDTEKHLIEGVRKYMNYPSYSLCGLLSLGGLAGLISLATVVVSNDTGPLHLAYSLQIPTVGIFWCGNMINGSPLSRQLHRQAISWAIHCPFCKKNIASTFPFQPQSLDCTHETSFVDDISVEEVVKITDTLLGISTPTLTRFEKTSRSTAINI